MERVLRQAKTLAQTVIEAILEIEKS
ncbi:protein of unknown function [Azospirillum baldaniorum]|uniref:Uncharacterized protein n=1 Tax=Azospirillum baldaniorum TaxID=1064539 RepID=A0A9P1JSX9_9PROT|nr:protein of unknown function [Azospirillum baldaniorum]